MHKLCGHLFLTSEGLNGPTLQNYFGGSFDDRGNRPSPDIRNTLMGEIDFACKPEHILEL